MRRASVWKVVFTGLLFPALVTMCGPAYCQNTTSALSGTVQDQTGAVIANAVITAINEASGERRATKSGAHGLFTIPSLLPGTYSLRVEVPGFSTKNITGVHLPANQQVSVGVLELQVGSAGQQVTVKADISEVQTATSERSALVTGQEVNQLALKGRDLVDMFRLLPGVVDLGATRDAPAPSNFGGVYINGARSTQRSVFMDGVTLNNPGSNNYIQRNVDPDSDYFRRYPSLVREFQAYAREHGFKGSYMATEVNWGTWPGEMRKSKIFLRAFLMNMGLGVTPFLNNAFDGSIYWNMTLLRNTFSQNPYNVVMPEAGYYAIRSLSAVMERAVVAESTAQFSDTATPYESYSFSRPVGELLLAIIAPGPAEDAATTRVHRTAVKIKNFRASGVDGIDLINGVEQKLYFRQEGQDVMVNDLRVPDYPVLLRLIPADGGSGAAR